jgi:hypothetical protein
MSWFATVEAQIVIHAVLPFCKGKVALFLKFTLTLGSVNLHVQRFFGDDFPDLSIQIATWTLRSFGEVARSSIEVPVLIKISGLIYKCC